MKKYQTIRDKIHDQKKSPFHIYRELTVGDSSVSQFVLYEILISTVGLIPGGLGLLLRKKLFPPMFAGCGSRLVMGRSVTLRHPKRICIGNSVTIDDFALLDARGGATKGIELGDQVIINRNCELKSKADSIEIGPRSIIGANTSITSLSGVVLGRGVLVGRLCTLSAGAYPIDDMTTMMIDLGPYSKGPIRIEDDVWIGAGAMILGGVTVSTHAVIGAGALVTKSVPRGAVVGGVPARLLRWRAQERSAATGEHVETTLLVGDGWI